MYCILPTNTTFRKERTQIQYQGTFLLRGKKGVHKGRDCNLYIYVQHVQSHCTTLLGHLRDLARMPVCEYMIC